MVRTAADPGGDAPRRGVLRPVRGTTKNVRLLFRAVLESDQGERWDLMAVFGDALEEAGFIELAAAYRWAAANERWPTRMASVLTEGVKVHSHPGWHGDTSETGGNAKLPSKLWESCCAVSSVCFGNNHRAFRRLAHALRDSGEMPA